MTPSDHDLICRIQKRDAKAFELLYARRNERIRRHLWSIVRDDAAADDLTQEVFMRLWTRAEQWKGRGTPEAWLLRIATNLALNHIRSDRRRRKRFKAESPLANALQDEPPDWMIDLDAADPEELAERAELCRKILSSVGELSEEQREVFKLIQQDEMDLASAAEILGIPEGTVKSRLHSARKRLARKWNDVQRSQR